VVGRCIDLFSAGQPVLVGSNVPITAGGDQEQRVHQQ